MSNGLRVKHVALCAALVVAACGQEPAPRGIRFAEYGAGYASKPDFAEVEHALPLDAADLARLTPADLRAFDQEQIDQIYARLTAGSLPDGPYDGGLLLPRGVSGNMRIAEIIGGLPGAAIGVKADMLEGVGNALWRGKIFDRSARLARNRIEDVTPLKAFLDGDASTIPTVQVDGKDQWLLFPARVYCGQSLLDSRRESIIVDYAFSDEIAGYRARPDGLAGRRGLQVRDEMRMVRPGFYLGRAYVGKVFLLNFTLHNKEADARPGRLFGGNAAPRDDCWTGTQQRQASSTR